MNRASTMLLERALSPPRAKPISAAARPPLLVPASALESGLSRRTPTALDSGLSRRAATILDPGLARRACTARFATTLVAGRHRLRGDIFRRRLVLVLDPGRVDLQYGVGVERAARGRPRVAHGHQLPPHVAGWREGPRPEEAPRHDTAGDGSSGDGRRACSLAGRRGTEEDALVGDEEEGQAGELVCRGGRGGRFIRLMRRVSA